MSLSHGCILFQYEENVLMKTFLTLTASAYLIGGQHIFTFDQATYDFSSPCNYVLARDMLHDNFSVVYNYEKRGRRPPVKSICFTIENNLNFDITDDFKVAYM